MSDETRGPAPAPVPLRDNPNLDWLRKQAKRRLEELREANPLAQLAEAQFDLAKRYGFSSWRALKAHVDSRTVDGQLFDAARKGAVDALGGYSTNTRTSCTRVRSRTSGRCCTSRHETAIWERSTCC